jgi:uncharacterized damage-inducible protein DinB
MNLEFLASQLNDNARRIRNLVEGVSAEQARWKPAATSWSILEVVNHLLDEEKEDFRVRLEITLHQPERPWPPIDPEGWVTARQYNQKDLQASLEGFLAEREASLAWLRGLTSANWDAVYDAPFGQITAGDLFASWVAHDLLHMRQLVELQWAYTAMSATPYRVEYAGSW